MTAEEAAGLPHGTILNDPNDENEGSRMLVDDDKWSEIRAEDEDLNLITRDSLKSLHAYYDVESRGTGSGPLNDELLLI